MNPFLDFLSQKKPEINKIISDYIEGVRINSRIPQPLNEGLIYAAEGGGKRLRPALTLLGWEAAKDFFRNDPSKEHFNVLAPEIFRRSALAVELIHTYSLVHDDLPAMDDDSLRRGRPTCHVRYDEATAILIGDALLNHSFEVLLAEPMIPSELVSQMEKMKVEEILSGYLRTMRILSVAAGAEGMIGGQVLDMEAENKKVNLEGLRKIHSHKTGKLIQASLNLVPAFYGDNKLVKALEKYGETIGLLYQVVDDILDVISTPEVLGKSGTDLINDKTTFIKLIGLDKARDYAKKLNQEAYDALKPLQVNDRGLSRRTVDYLIGFSNSILNRTF